MTRGNEISRRTGWRRLTAIVMAISLLAGIAVADNAKAQTIATPRKVSAPTLTKYSWDLTAAAEQGRFDSFTERREETDRAIQILSSSEKNNPVVLTDSPAIRDQVTAGVARRIARNDVPETLYGKRLLKLNLDLLFKDASNSAELVTLLSAILSDASESDSKLILLIDPIQALVGSSAAFDGAASGLLREAITKGQIQCIGGSTDINFKEKFISDESLAALFAGVELQEVTNADVQENAANATSDSAKSDGEEFVGDNISSDLRELIDSGRAPARVKAILQVNDTNSKALRTKLARYGVTIDAQMPQFGALAVDLPTKAIEKLAADGTTNYLSLDRPVAGLGHVEETTGDEVMLSQPGNSALDGSSIGVAVLDSGISSRHKSLNGRIVYSRDFTGEGTTDDPYGHGTFVAGMIASKHGSYGGIAPGAKLINFRVLDGDGTGRLSALLSALDAVMTNRSTYNIRVVNISLGVAAVDSYKNDALCRAVRRLVDAGIVVVAAAGNDGKDETHPKLYGRIHSPGNEPSALTVGAANTFGTDPRGDDGVTSYSSRGPTRSYWKDSKGVKHYDNLIKPDLVAPGNKIIGAAAPNNKLIQLNPDLLVGSDNTNNGKANMRLSGTSVSSPIVAGAVAVMLEANPRLTPNMVKMILMYTAQSLAKFNMLEQGAGELNVEGAVRLAKLVRTDLSSNTKVGASLLTSASPTPETTIAGHTFKWSQGVLFNYAWARGSELITKYQAIYGLGVLIGDGIVVADARGVLIADARGVLIADATKVSGGVLIGDNILVSNGITMSDGIVLFSCRVLMGDGILIADGIAVADGVLIGDGIAVADAGSKGVLIADGKGVLIADALKKGVLIADGIVVADSVKDIGDNTACMPEE
jgi:serine protease AprX